MNSLRDEIAFLFSGRGMPYQKVALVVSIVCAVIFTLVLGNNTIHEGAVAVIDLDNTKYSRDCIERIDASPFIKVKAVLNTPVQPESLFYEDQYIAVIYMPAQLEKNRYSSAAGTIGVFYDNTSLAHSAEIKAALNEIVAIENQTMSGAVASRMDQGMVLRERLLFNPAGSGANNGSVQGFLFFFSSMFFVFATIGMVPRLRMTGLLQQILLEGTPLDILIRLVPYSILLLCALVIGMVILHYLNDMHVAGSILLFYVTQLFYIPILGVLSLLFGWNSANPGVAASRMIFLIPGGFILGGTTAPIQELSHWVQVVSHVFPLRWEYEFIRDIVVRGAGFGDISFTAGAFLLYCSAVLGIFFGVFYWQRSKLIKAAMADGRE